MPTHYTAFHAATRIAAGDLPAVVRHAKTVLDSEPTASILLFNDATGQFVDIDLHGTPDQIETQLRYLLAAETGGSPDVTRNTAPATRGVGRPKLGVVAREVTLLPRQWDWLAAQPGGASVTLRRLVDQARAADAGREGIRQSQEAAYRFMSAMAGNQPGFEEAARALFARDHDRFAESTAAWPTDVRQYAASLAAPALQGEI